MKRKILSGLVLTLIVGLFMILTGSNSVSKSKKDSSLSKEKATKELIEGVFELVSPFQGLAIYLDDYFLFIIGTSDSTMYSSGGKYEISGDMITDNFLFSTLPNMAGSTEWTAEKLEENTIKGTMFNTDGSIIGDFRMIKKVNPTKEIRSQMKDIEGFYQYVAPYRGLSTMLGGYYIYMHGNNDSPMVAVAGTYITVGDKTTTKTQYATDSRVIGAESSWIKKSVVGNTLTWANVNEKGEITGSGQSVRPE